MKRAFDYTVADGSPRKRQLTHDGLPPKLRVSPPGSPHRSLPHRHVDDISTLHLPHLPPPPPPPHSSVNLPRESLQNQVAQNQSQREHSSPSKQAQHVAVSTPPSATPPMYQQTPSLSLPTYATADVSPGLAASSNATVVPTSKIMSVPRRMALHDRSQSFPDKRKPTPVSTAPHVSTSSLPQYAGVRAKSINTERLNATAINMLADFLRSNHPQHASRAFEFWKLPESELDSVLSDLFRSVHKPGIPEHHHNGPLDYSATTLKSYFSSLSRVFAANRPSPRGFACEPFKSGVLVALESRIKGMRRFSSSGRSSAGPPSTSNSLAASPFASSGRSQPMALPSAPNLMPRSSGGEPNFSNHVPHPKSGPSDIRPQETPPSTRGGKSDNIQSRCRVDGLLSENEREYNFAETNSDKISGWNQNDSRVPVMPDTQFHALWSAVCRANDPVKHMLRLFLVAATLFGDPDVDILSHMRTSDFKEERVREGQYEGREVLVFDKPSVRARAIARDGCDGSYRNNNSMSGRQRMQEYMIEKHDGDSLDTINCVFVVDMHEMGFQNNYSILKDYLRNRPIKGSDSFWLECNPDRSCSRNAFYSDHAMKRPSIASLTDRLYAEAGIENSHQCTNFSFHERINGKFGDTRDNRLRSHVGAERTMRTPRLSRSDDLATAEAWKPAQAVQAVRAVQALQTVQTVQAVQAVQAVHAINAARMNTMQSTNSSRSSLALSEGRDERCREHQARSPRKAKDNMTHIGGTRESYDLQQESVHSQGNGPVSGDRHNILCNDEQPQLGSTRNIDTFGDGGSKWGLGVIENVDLIVKLGGAALTHKAERQTLIGKDKFDSAIKDISRAYQRGSRMIICLGAGSFGHFEAREHHIVGGTANTRGMAVTHATVAKFSAFVVDALNRADVPAVGLSPFMCEFSGCSIVNCAVAVLRRGMIPVINGDVSYEGSDVSRMAPKVDGSSFDDSGNHDGGHTDRVNGVNCPRKRLRRYAQFYPHRDDQLKTRIVSADEVMVTLAACGLFPGIKRAVFVTDVAGIYGPLAKSGMRRDESHWHNVDIITRENVEKMNKKTFMPGSSDIGRSSNASDVQLWGGGLGSAGTELIRKVTVDEQGRALSHVELAKHVETGSVNVTGGIRGKLDCAGRIAGLAGGDVSVHIVGVGSPAMAAALDVRRSLQDSAFEECTTVVLGSRASG